MSEGKRQALKQAHKHWAKLRCAVRVSGAFRIAAKLNKGELEKNSSQWDSGLNQELLAKAGADNKEDEPAPTWTDDLKVFRERLEDEKWRTVMLLAVPLGIVAAQCNWAPWLIFWINFVGLIPLSGFLGQATEDIASYYNEVVAGLLNATFGNVVEMMVAVMALAHHDIIVVQSTLLGSILSNLLFVLGSCFLYGGFPSGDFPQELTFSSKAAGQQTSLLLLASISLVLPTAMYSVMSDQEGFAAGDDSIILPISRFASIVTFAIYIQFLYFQLVSHKDYFQEEDKDDEDEDEKKWSLSFSVLVLAIASVMTAYTSDYLVDSIHGYAEDMHLNKAFIGLILVASVGNIPEFYVTLMFAKDNKLDLALTVAVGSSCQMALLVTPFAVLAGWVMDVPMSLNFHPLQITCLLLAVLTVSSVIQGGSATWLHGSLLVGSYIIIGMMFFFLPVGVGSD